MNQSISLNLFEKVALYSPLSLRFRKPKYSHIHKYFAKTICGNVLDVGVANNSQHEWLSVFPNTLSYDGLDLIQPANWCNTIPSSNKQCTFYNINLNESLPSEQIDKYYDVVCVSHVLEHVLHPYALVKDLVGMLAPGGIMYLEYPNILALKESFVSSYCFYGDCTHVQPINTDLIIEACRGLDICFLRYGRCLTVGKFIFSSMASFCRLLSMRQGWRDPLLYVAGMVDFCVISRPRVPRLRSSW